MAGPEAPPCLIATIGLHASASTWVFNVVRELLIAAVGGGAVAGLYADRVDQVPDVAARAGRHVVIKSHPGSEALDAWLAEQGARLFISVRDPRDAAVSMAQRFAAHSSLAGRRLQLAAAPGSACVRPLALRRSLL